MITIPIFNTLATRTRTITLVISMGIGIRALCAFGGNASNLEKSLARPQVAGIYRYYRPQA
jgi:hypothetical protein